MFESATRVALSNGRSLLELAKDSGVAHRNFFSGADLNGCDLRGLDFSEYDLYATQLDGSVVDSRTIFGSTFAKPENYIIADITEKYFSDVKRVLMLDSHIVTAIYLCHWSINGRYPNEFGITYKVKTNDGEVSLFDYAVFNVFRIIPSLLSLYVRNNLIFGRQRALFLIRKFLPLDYPSQYLFFDVSDLNEYFSEAELIEVDDKQYTSLYHWSSAHGVKITYDIDRYLSELRAVATIRSKGSNVSFDRHCIEAYIEANFLI